MEYVFSCEVKHTDKQTGKIYVGKAEHKYRTVQISQPFTFQISPMEGTPFETEFTLSIGKIVGNMKPSYPLKCEFGYYNMLGKVVIPTKDTGDFLK